jgi:hypothetical protein
LEIDGEAKKQDEDPCVVRKRLYKLPPYRTTKLI